MNLKCKINNKTYDVVEGLTFSKEYNETLDSATLILDHVDKINDIKPYDDVFIYEGTFNGYSNKTTELIGIKTVNDFQNGYIYIKGDFTSYLPVDSDKQDIVYKFINSNTDIIGIEHCTISLVSGEYRLYNSLNEYKVLTQVTYDNETYYRLDYGTGAFVGDYAYFETFDLIIPKSPVALPTFFAHFLIDQFAEEKLIATSIESETKYKYKIELFSETKKLETIQLPNICITQPLDITKKRSVYDYIKQYVDLYGTKIKRTKGNNLWYYDNKYVLDSDLESIFGNVYCPDFSLNNPSLRDVLNQLMLVKDRIVVVINDVITSMDITQRGDEFDNYGVTRVSGSMSSDNYASNLKRTYNNALSGYSSARRVERLGFRNSDNALMTIGNMRLETKFPIYKINKVLMCYYKKATIVAPHNIQGSKQFNFEIPAGSGQTFVEFTIEYYVDSGSLSASVDNPQVTATPTYVNNADGTSTITVELTTQENLADGILTVTYTYSGTNRNIAFLCKQDITKLVKLEQEKQTLSKDWNDFTNLNKPNTVEEMAEFKLCTVSYSIGSNIIDGWGTKYQYPKYWWNKDATYIQNIFTLMDINYRYGNANYGFITKDLKEQETLVLYEPTEANRLDVIVSPFSASARLKSFFFEVDYEAFYNGTVVHSKDIDIDDVTINDNSSSSLTLLDKDGLFQKEKINRFGNVSRTIEAVYDSLADVQDLGSVYGDDEIIYHVEIQIWQNFIKVTYYATKDYVLKNYFTSVYAKHRPFSLIDYNQSVIRAENRKLFIELAKDKLYYEKRTANSPTMNNNIDFYNFGGNSFIDEILSFTKETQKPTSIDKFVYPDKINFGIALFDNEIYAADINVFSCGYSLCFNMQMVDNISMGQYIKVANPDMSDISSVEDDYTGSVTDFYETIDDTDTGFAREFGFYFAHIDNDYTFSNDVLIDLPTTQQDLDNLYKPLFDLPKFNVSKEKNIIGNTFIIDKDNKELLDMTYQLEPFTKDKDILFSEWLLKLSELNGVYNKFHEFFTVKDTKNDDGYIGSFAGITATEQYTIDTLIGYRGLMILQIPNADFSSLNVGANINMTYVWDEPKYEGVAYWFSSSIVGYVVSFLNITAKTGNSISIRAIVQKTIRHGLWGGTTTETETRVFTFTKTTQLYNVDFSWDTINSYYYEYCENGQYARSGKNIVDGTTSAFDNSNSDVVNVKYSGIIGEIKSYSKNTFVVTSTHKLKNTLVYDEYDFNDNPLNITTHNPSDIFKTVENSTGNIIQTERPTYINVDLSNFNHNVKSIQLWYNDNDTLRFVFGVNVTNADFTRGYIRIYASILSKKDKRVYNNNNIVVGETKNYIDDKDNYGTNQEYVVKSN